MLDKFRGKFDSLVKKRIYKEKISRFKKTLIIMIVGGLCLSTIYIVRHIYIEYAVSKAHISFVYPEIADGLYPNGSRFSVYDLICRDRVEDALLAMQKKGKYTNFTVDDLINQFEEYSYLESSIGDTVAYKRFEGTNFSYYSNEFILIFVQPHDYKSKNVLDWFWAKDYSDEFLNELVDANKKYIETMYGGSGGFIRLTTTEDLELYDYAEKVTYFNTQINSIISTLNNYENDSNGFLSTQTGYRFSDLLNSYKILKSERLGTISSYITSSHLTSDLEVFFNKVLTEIDTNTLEYNKFKDEADLNNYASVAYDHTFTENLIVVSANEENGLYQARPKTAYDTVVQQYLDAKNSSDEYSVTIAKGNEDIVNYSGIANNSEEYLRLCNKCDKLFDEFQSSYQELNETTNISIGEYLSTRNNGFLTAKVSRRKILSEKFFLKILIAFCLGATCAFIIYILRDEAKHRRRLKKKRKIIKMLQGKGV